MTTALYALAYLVTLGLTVRLVRWLASVNERNWPEPVDLAVWRAAQERVREINYSQKEE